MKFILDTDSGTLIPLDTCVIINEDDLTWMGRRILEDGSDNERIDLGNLVGISLKTTLETKEVTL